MQRFFLTTLLIISFVFTCSARHNEGDTSYSRNSRIEDSIINMIFTLPEVKSEMKMVRKKSHDKRHLGCAIVGQPSKESNYYQIKVWEDNGASYYTHFNFYLHPKNFNIMCDDIVNDSMVDYQTWHKQKIKH